MKWNFKDEERIEWSETMAQMKVNTSHEESPHLGSIYISSSHGPSY